jgi:Homocysteine S-methyltransferase
MSCRGPRGLHPAGADVVIAKTFATARCHLEAAGLGQRLAEVNGGAVELARGARDRAAGAWDVWVADTRHAWRVRRPATCWFAPFPGKG